MEHSSPHPIRTGRRRGQGGEGGGEGEEEERRGCEETRIRHGDIGGGAQRDIGDIGGAQREIRGIGGAWRVVSWGIHPQSSTNVSRELAHRLQRSRRGVLREHKLPRQDECEPKSTSEQQVWGSRGSMSVLGAA